MHVRGMREIDIPQLSGFLQEIYDKFSYDELTDIQGFIEKLKNRNCLFIYNETSNTFCFNNLSFQEYFASIFYDDSNEQELVDNICEIRELIPNFATPLRAGNVRVLTI